jgi:hypothetical protein
VKALNLVRTACPSYCPIGPFGIKDYCCEEYEVSDGRSLRCLLVTGSKIPCSRFIEAIAPTDAEAQAEYLSALGGVAVSAPKKIERRATCMTCGEEYPTSSSRSGYCSARCRDAARRRQYRESKKRTRDMKSDERINLQRPQIPQFDTPETRILSGSINGNLTR